MNNEKIIHDLALVYAKVKLQEMQQHFDYGLDCSDEELRTLAKFYSFAVDYLPGHLDDFK